MKEATLRKPDWLRKRLMANQTLHEVHALLRQCGLNTVCEEAHCPNLGECFSKGTSTFMILGNQCTRDCTFCAVSHGNTVSPNKAEPEMIAEAVRKLRLRYAVITSVTRDDLPDGGAGHFAETIKAIKRNNPETLVEVLIPDFEGSPIALETVIEAKPDVINHNVETIPRLYPEVRPQAVYERSLNVLKYVKETDSSIPTKTGFMLGLGEEKNEVLDMLLDIYRAGCEIVTIGQYLSPSPDHHPIVRYVPPEEFSDLKEHAHEIGLRAVASGPFVRSSYCAHEIFSDLKAENPTQACCFGGERNPLQIKPQTRITVRAKNI